MIFDYNGARNSGYSDDEILDFLQEEHPYFDVKGAVKSGYNPQEISTYLDSIQPENQPERSVAEKAGRIAGQYAIGAAENALLPYELGVAPLASREAQNMAYRETLGEDLERLMEQKSSGDWDQQDQELLDSIQDQIRNPQKSIEFAQTADIGVRGLAEKATGLDLQPEGVLEKAAGWAGFIKDPKKLFSLAKEGLSLGKLIKALAPTGTEAMRGVGAGTALQMAEEGQFGPIGTMAAAVVGDVAGAGAAGLGKGAVKLVTNPKKALAEATASFVPKEKLALQKEIIEDFRAAGIQADLGTIADSNLIKWTQSRLAQSGLTGKALDEFKKEITDQIKREYGKLADTLGELKTASTHEAGEVTKEGLKSIRDADLAATRQYYQRANEALKESSYVNANRLASSIEKLEKQLKPGAIKSGEQKIVLDVLEKLKRDVTDSTGKPMFASVKDLMNNKIALNDIINYEVQGGSKQLLKGIVAELDRTIISHGKENPGFAKNYVTANKKFSEHAKTFRNKSVDQILKASDPSQLFNKMNSVQGIRDLGKVLNKTPEGVQIFNQMKRLKLEKVVGDNLVDSTSKQVKLGTFSKILEKSKNREIIKEILGPQDFKRLERLQKNAGRLAEAADKFYNASKSGAVATDAAVIFKATKDFVSLLSGNPWPLAMTTIGYIGAKKTSQLLANPEFLKLAEEAVLASEKGSKDQLVNIFMQMKPYVLEGMEQEKEFEQNQQSFR